MKIFENTTALAAATLTAGQMVSVKEVGEYRIKASGSGITLANGNIAVPVASGTAVNVKQFGAVGDGVADDTAAIQAALDSSFNVFFPTGNYLITTALELSTGHNVQGEYSSDRGTRITASGCDAFHITAKDTRIEGFRIYLDNTYWAFTYAKPAGESSSFNNVNNNNYVNNGGAFNLTEFSRSFVTNFNGNNLDHGVYITGYSQNSSFVGCLFQGHNTPSNNVLGEYGLKVDIGDGNKKEGINFTDCKFVSFYDGFVNNDLEYSNFVNCMFDVITRYGYYHTGFNKNINFSECYFGQQGFVTFPTSNGYKAFIEFASLASEVNLYHVFSDCYFVCYSGTYGPDILANIREKNLGVTFTECTDLMSQTAQSVALVSAKSCKIYKNQTFGSVVSSGVYNATEAYGFDKSNYVEYSRSAMTQELSDRIELLSGTGNSGSLSSKLMYVNSTEQRKTFRVVIQENTSSFESAKQYLIQMSYPRDCSVNDGIQLIATAAVDSGALNRVAPTLSATTSATDKAMTFDWSAFITTTIYIERIL